jgi:hypothetical protein
VILTAASRFSILYLQSDFFGATAVVNIGKSAAGVIKLVIRAIETKEAAVSVDFPPPEAGSGKILIEDGEYASENYYGMMIGLNATVTMCGGEVHGGNGNGTGFPGVGLVYGGVLNMAGGNIVGGNSSALSSHYGAGLALYSDASTYPTATITGGTITGGSFLGEDGNYHSISVYAGYMTKVHLAGGNLSGDLLVEPEGTVIVYGEKYLSYENGLLTGKLCDGSELGVGGLLVHGGGNVELMDCSDAPKIEECGKKAKSGKEDALHRTRQKGSKAK